MRILCDIDGTLRDIYSPTIEFNRTRRYHSMAAEYNNIQYHTKPFLVGKTKYSIPDYIMEYSLIERSVEMAPKTKEFDKIVKFLHLANGIDGVSINIVSSIPVVNYGSLHYASKSMQWFDATEVWIDENIPEFINRFILIPPIVRPYVSDMLIDDYPYSKNENWKSKIFVVPRPWNADIRPFYEGINGLLRLDGEKLENMIVQLQNKNN